jgi:hypothetical protein
MQIDTQEAAEALVGRTLLWQVMGVGVAVTVASISFQGPIAGAIAICAPVGGTGELEVHAAWLKEIAGASAPERSISTSDAADANAGLGAEDIDLGDFIRGDH